jgi:hypothetical protein
MASDADLPSSWNAEEAGPKKSHTLTIVIVVVVVALAVGGALVIAQRSKPEPKKDWPASTSGGPSGFSNTAASDVKVEAKPGVYVWSDFKGWHVWAVNGEKVAGLKGTISSDKDFSDAKAAIKGVGTVKKDGDTITIDLPASPGLVGVDFNPGFYAKHLHFDLEGQDGKLDPSVIVKGPKGTVASVPFDIDKVLAKDAAKS